MKSLSLIVLLSILILAGCGPFTLPPLPVVPPPPAPPPPLITHAGGSNYDFYQLDAGCVREPYGVLANYHKATAQIDSQIEAMYASGQRSMRLMIYHWDGYQFINGVLTKYQGPWGGTLVDSTGGTLTPQVKTNLANLLAKLKSVGFQEVEIAFGPQGANSIAFWPSWNEAYFQQDWQLIESTRPILVASGLKYYIDLANEQSPNKYWTWYQTQITYDQRMWVLYSTAYGTADTVGFSMVADVSVADDAVTVYGTVWPAFLDIHLYSNAYSLFKAMSVSLKSQQHEKDWIIGETYYNDPVEADGLKQAITETGQHVRFLTQWPLTSTKTCDAVDVIPLAFDQYTKLGF